jgi:hypothetical protein
MNSNMNKLLNDIYMSDVIDSLRLIDWSRGRREEVERIDW